jgi:hypothetical protein
MAEKLIWRSDTGHRAWECPDSGLPRGYRLILDLLGTALPEPKVIHTLQGFEAKQIRRWIDELETLCFIHASRIDESHGYLNEKAA